MFPENQSIDIFFSPVATNLPWPRGQARAYEAELAALGLAVQRQVNWGVAAKDDMMGDMMVSINGGTPIAGWFIMFIDVYSGKSQSKVDDFGVALR